MAFLTNDTAIIALKSYSTFKGNYNSIIVQCPCFCTAFTISTLFNQVCLIEKKYLFNKRPRNNQGTAQP